MRRGEFATFRLIELHSIPASPRAGLQDIEPAASSQRVSERLHNLLAVGDGRPMSELGLGCQNTSRGGNVGRLFSAVDYSWIAAISGWMPVILLLLCFAAYRNAASISARCSSDAPSACNSSFACARENS
jgi:hypothetical protein